MSSLKSYILSLLFIFLCSSITTLSTASEEKVWQPPASNEDLPSIPNLPDVLMGEAGESIRTQEAWEKRRNTLKEIILYYQYGRIPPRPDQVTGTLIKSVPHKSGKGTEDWILLKIGSQRPLEMRIVIYRPKNEGKLPVIIREEGHLGGTRQVPMFLDAGFMFIEYARHDLDPDRKGVKGPAQQKYSDYDWETLAVWAWGGMRVIDYLETRQDVDLKRIGITGHSRGGKMALLAGALDERFTLVVPNGSGAGGAGSYRVLGPGAESLGMNDKPHWYHERIQWFDEKEDRLPFDQHFLKALVAPRLLLCTESVDDEFANPEGTQATSVAAHRVFELYGVPKKNGLYYRGGKHASNDEDWKAQLDFAQWHWFGKPPPNPERFWKTPYDLPRELVSDSRSIPIKTALEAHSSPQDQAIEFVRVGDAGNSPDRNNEGRGVFGDVTYCFNISKRQITNTEYAFFLNAVGKSDPNGLYNLRMGTNQGGILRMGDSGEYQYYVKNTKAQLPVTFVAFHDAARYANWLHNGKPQGEQSSATTEDGAYKIQGTQVSSRNVHARYSLPSENEWYKAVYFLGDPSNKKYKYQLFVPRLLGGYNLMSHPKNWVTAYGLENVNNNVWVWNEARVGKIFRGLRSGAWFLGNNRQSAGRFFSNPTLELSKIGFRVVRHEKLSAKDLPKVKVANIRRVFHNGEHNAFTDLILYQNNYYLAFRSCPDGHGVQPTASIIILKSADLKSWSPVHQFSVPERDTRDPHFLSFKGKLFVYTGTWYYGKPGTKRTRFDLNEHLGYCVWTPDAKNWSPPTLLEGTFGHYIWKANTFNGTAYLCGRRKFSFRVGPKGEGVDVKSVILESEDGLIWKKRGFFQDTHGDETAFQFLPDGTIVGIGRRARSAAEFLTAKPPYREWERRDLKEYIGGPLITQWGNRWVVGGRKNTPRGPKTVLQWFVRGELHPFVELPSAGDNSYPGFIDLGEGKAVVSWYSSHEKDAQGKRITAIYMADLELK